MCGGTGQIHDAKEDETSHRKSAEAAAAEAAAQLRAAEAQRKAQLDKLQEIKELRHQLMMKIIEGM
jgi:hypothetical protein